MKWRSWLGRSLIFLSALIFSGIFFFLGFIQGIFDGLNESEAMLANMMYAASVVTFLAAGFVWTRHIKWATIFTIGTIVLGLAAFNSVDGLGSDIYPFLLAFPVMGFGYWLVQSRKTITR